MGATEKARIRREAGLERGSWENEPDDFTIRGLKQLLKYLSALEPIEARVRAGMLWDALADLEGRGTATFYGSYRWGYSFETKTARFDASFVRMLSETAWVPDTNGVLEPPNLVVFDTLEWKPNSFLLTRIAFKPPIIDQLAKEAGIDPAVLDLLRKNPGVVAEFVSRLATTKQQEEAEPDVDVPSDNDVYDDAKDLYGDDMPDIPPGTPNPDDGDDVGNGVGRGGQGRADGTPRGNGQGSGGAHGGSSSHDASGGKGSGNGAGRGKRTPGKTGACPFICTSSDLI